MLSLTAACASAPSPIESHIAEAAAGEVTIVEFVDYRCTHCQTMFDVLAPLLDMYEGRVHLVIRQVPLEKHHGAREVTPGLNAFERHATTGGNDRQR
jgi:protein-disulfide isomerase